MSSYLKTNNSNINKEDKQQTIKENKSKSILFDSKVDRGEDRRKNYRMNSGHRLVDLITYY